MTRAHLISVVLLSHAICLRRCLAQSGAVLDVDSFLSETRFHLGGFALNLFAARTASNYIVFTKAADLGCASTRIDRDLVTQLLQLRSENRAIDLRGVTLTAIQLERLDWLDPTVVRFGYIEDNCVGV